ncbi:MAG: cytochrome C [Rhizobiales bacterium]|nr:cytochrome C [Hyphomicrobiales bacterium]
MNSRRAMAVVFGGASLILGIAAATHAADVPAAPGTVAAQPISAQYRLYCSGCHGAAGEGGGDLAFASGKTPADLTMLTSRNGGMFPRERVLQVIDGRADVEEHGARDMPVWGEWFKYEAGEGLGGLEGNEGVVRQRVQAMADFIATLQKK